MPERAFITGVAGTALSPAERSFVRQADPWGCILFKRNIEAPAQVSRLTASFREAVGRNAPVLVDQEGGRVQRLGLPHWPAYPAGAVFGRIYEQDPARGIKAAHLGACLIAADLAAVGIDVDCLPLADLLVPGANPVIGDRSYGDNAEKVAMLARSSAEGLLAGGVLPVLKHMPGHGRAMADSHGELPIVETDRATLVDTDFAAFKPLAGLPLGMTAHVVYTAIDPIAPATTSVTLVQDVIRGLIGFRGLLMSDDISMGALSGSIDARARATIAAGCDVVLHCNGRLDEMEEVAAAVPALGGRSAVRADAALAQRGAPKVMNDILPVRAEWAALMDFPAAAWGVTS
jgi:beta-N-acetylhexosaminidase